MTVLGDVISQSSRRIAGVMSGTSLDGIDVAIVRCAGAGNELTYTVEGFTCVEYPAEVKAALLRNSSPESSRIDEINDLNALLPYLYAKAISLATRNVGITLGQFDAIGVHGQTVYHNARRRNLFNTGITSGATLQLGDVSMLAKLTGVVTVGNFRAGDIALGGEGAPLVPYVDYLLFRSQDKSRIMLNIGGISNFTYLPKGCALENIIAADCGPGNMMIDSAMSMLFGKSFDRDGEVASRGTVNSDALKLLLKENFFHSERISTGREDFGDKSVKKFLSECSRLKNEDVIATLTFFTAQSIYHSVQEKLKGSPTDEILVSGGGAHNGTMMKFLSEKFSPIHVENIRMNGITPDSKEAVAFAVLASETLNGNPTNLPLVTGSARRTVLGMIGLP